MIIRHGLLRSVDFRTTFTRQNNDDRLRFQRVGRTSK